MENKDNKDNQEQNSNRSDIVPDEFVSPNPKRKVLAVWITIITLAIVSIFIWLSKSITKEQMRVSVPWENSYDIGLDSYPSWFLYNNDKDSLETLKAISNTDKQTLLGLVNETDSGYMHYQRQIDKLAFESNRKQGETFWIFLILGGFAAMIGVQIRTISDFIGQSSYLNKINIKRWWPWYWMRPLLGFIAGVSFILIWNAALISDDFGLSNTISLKVTYGITIIIGFGLPDFLSWLRFISKAFFGRRDTPSSAGSQSGSGSAG